MDSPRTPTDDPQASQPGHRNDSERKAAGTVFTVMVGALLLSALMSADTMLARAEAGELGWSRDLSLLFWQPIETAGSTIGLTAPRQGLEALRDMDNSGPVQPTFNDETFEDQAADRRAPPTVERESGSSPGPTLGHAPTRPATKSNAGEPDRASALPDPAGPERDGPLAPTRPGLPGLPPLETVRRDAEPSFALRRPTAEDPLRVLIIGDSTVDAVGSSMLRELAATGITSAVLDFRVSSGLSRPDFFDWPAHLAQLTPQLEPEIVIVMLGANDAQAFAIDNKAVEFGTEQWFATYRARVGAILDQLTSENRWVVWIGQPVMRTAAFDAKMRQVNQLYVEEVARYRNAVFVDSRTVTVDEAGAYAAYLADESGTLQPIRQNDGVHLTPAGGDRLSSVIIAAINEIAPLY